ncbi:hypothetical protein AAE02nite_16840 [Adhaeribacter aerolatus]|uniref:VanZ-like domain-containing protein n=1 Tax=Adhaeribacter aerolatus TaxID=670289 RepID=A0A512AWG3_9BACT|nr:VanZ family protein [Adhaeribacter aerolatus]GEO04020.1 hypothetical protein AAE02nite_16840 [Adhaeribacter aerolatus]
MINTVLDNNFLKYFFRASLCIYLVVLCWVLFFQVGTTDRDTYFVNPDDHLLPFHSTIEMLKKAFAYRYAPHGDQFRDIFLINIMGNLVLLLPWGFLAPLVLGKLHNVKRVAISGFLISFSAEVIQFTFSLGIADVDDLIYNTIGAVMGFYLLQIAKYMLFKMTDLPLNRLSNKEYNQKSA